MYNNIPKPEPIKPTRGRNRKEKPINLFYDLNSDNSIPIKK